MRIRETLSQHKQELTPAVEAAVCIYYYICKAQIILNTRMFYTAFSLQKKDEPVKELLHVSSPGFPAHLTCGYTIK